MLRFELDQAFLKFIEDIDKVDLCDTPFDENIIISELKLFNPLCFAFSKVVPFLQRLTINKNLQDNNNETITQLKLLKNPPLDVMKKLDRYGRANLKDQSVLYASYIFPTLIKETKPEIGDLVTISKWKLKNDNTPLIVYPVIDYQNCNDSQLRSEFEYALLQQPKEWQEMIFKHYCLISRHFGKYVEKGKEINYIFSAHFADKIFHKIYDGKIEAIIYPSVQDSGISNNIAIKPDIFNEKYEIDEISEEVVFSKGRQSQFLKSIKSTRKVDSGGKIIWG
jgi:hypothetical protein